jgi:hypothetical protein
MTASARAANELPPTSHWARQGRAPAPCHKSHGVAPRRSSRDLRPSAIGHLTPSQTNRLLAASAAEPTALTNGYQLSFAIGAGLVLVALVVAVTVLRSAEEAEEGALHERDRLLGDAPDGGTAAARVR